MILTFPDLESLSQAAARHIVLTGQRSIDDRGVFELALSGGNTPNRTYELLGETAGQRDLWENTHFYWGDERCVPPDHPQSNYGAARRVLLDALRVPPENIHRIRAEDPNRHRAAEEYAAIFPAQPDLLLLGMGGDGHTASLFPGSPALDETDERFVATESPKEPRLRITITPPAIAAAQMIMVLVSGGDKADALRRVFAPRGDAHETPARLVRDAVWLIGGEAAKGFVGKKAT